jgi:hypothetical protein
MLDDIIPDREWTSDIGVSICPRILWERIERTIDHHRFLSLRVYSYADHLIGMEYCTVRFVVTPVGSGNGMEFLG